MATAVASLYGRAAGDDDIVLTALSSVSEFALPAQGTSVRLLIAVALRFREGVLVVEALPDYDECDMRLMPEPVLSREDADGVWDVVSDREPWNRFVGDAACLWRWRLTNQSGFTDGAQVHLRVRGGDAAEVQWMVEASGLRPSVLTPLVGRE